MNCLKARRARTMKLGTKSYSIKQLNHWSHNPHLPQSGNALGHGNNLHQSIFQISVDENYRQDLPMNLLSVGRFLPTHSFSTSIYSVPTLLLFRLFYHAAPFIPQKSKSECFRLGEAPASNGSSKSVSTARMCRPCNAGADFLETYSKIRVGEFLNVVKANQSLDRNLTVKSITWVKALASPLSHEYVQFLVQDRRDAGMHRLVVERTDEGDIITVGWDWTTGQYASLQHTLPLPLVTLNLDQNHGISPVSLQVFIEIVNNISRERPYRLTREMCWWYAEKLLLETARRFPGAIVEEWPFSNLRYSFIVRTKWIKRAELVKAAEEFHETNVRDMRY